MHAFAAGLTGLPLLSAAGACPEPTAAGHRRAGRHAGRRRADRAASAPPPPSPGPAAAAREAEGVPSDGAQGDDRRRSRLHRRQRGDGRHRRGAARPAGAPCRRGAAQPARRLRQPQRRLRQPHAGAHPRRRGQPHAGADRRHRGQQHRRRRVRLLQPLRRGHRAHRGDPRAHERPLRLQRRGRRHQHHHPRAGRGPSTVSLRTEGGSFGTRDVAVRASGGSDKAHLVARPTIGARPTASTSRPLGDERDGSRIGTFTVRGGATLLPGVTLDFTVRHSDKLSDRDGFGGVRRRHARPPPSTIARRSSNRVFLAGANLRWETLGGRLDAGAPRQPQRHDHRRHRPLASSRAAAATSARRRSSPISPPTGSTCRRCGTKHAFSGRVEKEDERFTPEGNFADGLRARARPHGLHGRVARRLRRPAVPHRRHPPRRQRQLPGLHDLAHGRLAGAVGARHAAACQRRHGGEAAHHVRAVRHQPVLRAQPGADAGGELRLGRRRRVHLPQGAWRSSTSPISAPTSPNKINGTAPGPRPRHVHRPSTCRARARARASRSSARFKLDARPDARAAPTPTPTPARPTASASSAGRRTAGARRPRLCLRRAGAARRPSPPSTTAAWTTSRSRCRSSSRRSAWRSTPTGWSTPRSPTSCSRAWRCSARVENAARSALSRGVRLRGAADCGLCGRQADVRRRGRHRHRLGEVANAPERLAAAAGRRSRWRLRRWRGLMRRGRRAICRAGGGASRAASSRSTCAPTSCWSSWCERARIAAVTHLAADPAVSAIPEKARGIPITRGGGRGRAALRSRSRAGRAVRRLGHASTCCAGSARNVVVVPLPHDLDGVRAAVRTVAAAVGEEARRRGA